MNSMVEILAIYAIKQPDVLFVADQSGNEYSYKEMYEKVKTVAYSLKIKFGIKKNDKVMCKSYQDANFLLVNFACELLGAVFVPIENEVSLERKKEILCETESVIIIQNEEEELLDKVVLYDEIISENTMIKEEYFQKESDIAQILYTTGTTGTSKGIVISNKANVALAENIKYGVKMKVDNVELIPVPISHSHGLRCCYANLLNGGTIVLVDGLFKIKEIFSLIDKYSVTALDVSPSAIMMLIKMSKGIFWDYGKKLDYIQIGTSKLGESLKEELIENLPDTRLYNFYGSTESGRSCVLEFSKEQGKKNCIGKPTKNAKIVFVDESGKEILTSEESLGLLASSGNMNMTCYWKNEELTKSVMNDGLIYTSDLGYIDEEGYVYIVGRKGDVISCNGIKISPEEIEEVAIRFIGVTDAACGYRLDDIAGQVPILYITINSEFDMSEYQRFIKENIDGNKFPREIKIIDEIPRTYNGKIKRRDLHE